MLSTVDNSGLTQLVTFPTRGESILDLVLSNHSIQWYPNLNLSIKLNKKEPRFEYKFNNADFNEVRMDATKLSKAFLARNSSDYSLEDNWQFFKTGLRVHGEIPHG